MQLVTSIAAAIAVHGLVIVGLGQLGDAKALHSSVPALVIVHVVPATPRPVEEAAPPPAPRLPSLAPMHPPARPRHTSPPPRRLDRAAEQPGQLALPPEPDRPSPILPDAPPPPPSLEPASAGSVVAATPSHGRSVTAKPRYRSNPTPDYPSASLRYREEGTVLLLIDVTADGRAAAVALKQTSGFPLLDEAALECAKDWTFEPGRLDGQPVASQAIVPVQFSLDNR